DGAREYRPARPPSAADVLGSDLAEGRPEPLLAGRVRVGHELDAVGVVELLEAFREELEHQRARNLGALDRDGRRDAAEPGQRNALFSFWKNPSSASYVSAPALRSMSSSSSRCSSFSLRGTWTLTSTRWSP